MRGGPPLPAAPSAGPGMETSGAGTGVAWPEGRVSVLAGFVEAGETMEAAVSREVHEEVGIQVTEVTAAGPFCVPATGNFAIDGVAEATANFAKLASGRLSDRSRTRKPWVAAGYGLDGSAIQRTLDAYQAATARLHSDLRERVIGQTTQLLSALSAPDPASEWNTRRDSALAALERIRSIDYTVIICDAHQPHLEGIGFVRAVSKIRPERPVLLRMEKHDEDLIRQAMSAGAYDVLVDPAQEATVLFAMHRALEASQLRCQVKREEERLLTAMRSMLTSLEVLYGAYGLQSHFEAFMAQARPHLDRPPRTA